MIVFLPANVEIISLRVVCISIKYRPFFQVMSSSRHYLHVLNSKSLILLISLLTQLLGSGTASPISTDLVSRNENSKRFNHKWVLADLNDEFKGLHWDKAFDTCNEEQLDKMIFSTRATMWMFDLVKEDTSFEYSQAWNWYFGNYQTWLKGGDKEKMTASSIQREQSSSVYRVIRVR